MLNRSIQSILLEKFDAGLISRIPKEKAPLNSFVACQDIDLNDKLLPIKAKGHSKYNSSGISSNPIRGGCVYKRKDGTKYYVVACGGKIYYSVAGSGTWTAYQVGGSDMTIDSDADVEFAVYNNKLYVVTGKYPVITNAGAPYTTSRMIKVDGTTVTALTVSDIPQGLKFIAIINERMFGANSIDQPNGLYWTEPLFDYSTNSETNWTPAYGANYDYVGKEDGEVISGLIPYDGDAFIFKPRNVYRYTTQGDITQWASVRVDTKYGALYQRTIQLLGGYLYYLSPDGVVKFDGTNADLVDDAIRDKILALPQLKTNVRQWTQTTTSDFDAGSFGSLVIDTADNQVKQKPQTSQADWDAGTKTNIDTSSSPGDLKMATPCNEWAIGKTATMARGYGQPGEANDGNTGTYADPMYPYDNFNDSWWKVDLGSVKNINCIHIQYTQNGVNADLQYSTNGTDWFNLVTAINFYYGFIFTKVSCRYLRIYITHSPGATWNSFQISDFRAYENYGEFISQTINFGFVPASLGNLAAQITTGGNSLTFQTRSSVDGVSWDAWTDIGSAGENGGAINSTARQYLQWKAFFVGNYSQEYGDVSVTGTASHTIHQVYVGSIWRSAINNLGAAPSSWGKFDAVYTLNAQTATFWMRSAATEGGVSAATWYQQTPGATVSSVGLNQYIQVEIRFNTTDYSQVPNVDSFQVTYYTGSNLVSPCAAVWKKGYWLNVTNAGSSVNDIVYRYDVAGYWLPRSNKKNNVYFIDEDKLLSGTSESDGFVRSNDTGTKDDATNIDSWFELPKLEIARYEKIFREVKLTYQADASWTFSYKIDDGSYTDMTISSNSAVSTVRKVLEGIKTGKFIQLKFRQNSEDTNWQIHAAELFYQLWRELNAA